MKKHFSIIFLVLFSSLLSAQLPKGLVVNAKSVNVEEYKYAMNMRKADDAIVYYGSTLSLRMIKIKGFKSVNGKVLLAVKLKIKDKTGKVILENGDVFKDDNAKGGLDEEKINASLDLMVTVSSPLKMKEEYTAEFFVDDKNGPAEISGSFKFSSRLMPICTYNESGLKSDGPLFYTTPDNKIVTTQTLNNPKELYAVFNNIKGFTSVKGKIFPDARVTVKDSRGRTIHDFIDLFKSDNEKGGVNEADVKDRVALNFSFAEEPAAGEQYTCIFYVGDKKSKNSLTTTITVIWLK